MKLIGKVIVASLMLSDFLFVKVYISNKITYGGLVNNYNMELIEETKNDIIRVKINIQEEGP